MNEIIEQLAEIADRYTDGYLESKGEYHPDWHTVRDNKFAELIIRECLGVTLDYKNDDHYNGWIEYRDEIRQHFGIEQ